MASDLLISSCEEPDSDYIPAKTNMTVCAAHLGKGTNKCDSWHGHMLSQWGPGTQNKWYFPLIVILTH